VFQEFGDSARARKLYAAESDDEEEEELEPNPKLAGGKTTQQSINAWNQILNLPEDNPTINQYMELNPLNCRR
jgi:hypothetical protein